MDEYVRPQSLFAYFPSTRIRYKTLAYSSLTGHCDLCFGNKRSAKKYLRRHLQHGVIIPVKSGKKTDWIVRYNPYRDYMGDCRGKLRNQFGD
jgi:hypothetical protein